ncbi:DddA-like double-stranded DNA deaminase toxin [Kribbella sp. NPDC020789]
MPSELQRVAQQLLAALDEIPRVIAYLHDSARKYRESAAWIGTTSNNPSARVAATHLDEAARRCEEAAHHLSLAPPKARAWTEQMVSGIRTEEPTGSKPDGDVPPGDRPQSGPKAIKSGKAPGSNEERSSEDKPVQPGMTDEERLRLLNKLPVRGQKFGQREKTRGIWRDDDGAEYDLVSGRDDDSIGDENQDLYRQAEEFAIQHRLGKPPGTLSITSHVEIKFAMLMWKRGLRDATIVINNPPCKGDASCDRWLDKFLPPGARLTIYGPDNFKKTYRKPPPSEGP